MREFLFVAASSCALLVVGCTPLSESAGPYSAMDGEFSKATSFNLAQQVNNPERLTKPAEIGLPNNQAAVGAVERYQKGEVRDVDNDLGDVGSK